MNPFKKVNVHFDGKTFNIIGEEEESSKEKGRVKKLKADHPCIFDFDAEIIDPEIIGTVLDDLLEPDILCEVEHCVRAPDPNEAPLLHRSGGAPINLTLRM